MPSQERPTDGEPDTREPADALASDEPITDIGQDRLGRAPFARALARTVERAPRRSGFVIAVTGPWGDGKTSVLNMAAGELCQRRSVEIVRFNPWLFSGTEDLLGRFFAELAAQLPDDDGPLKAVGNGLRRYAEVVTPLKSLPWLGSVLEATGQLAEGAAGLISPTEVAVHERARELRAALRRLPKPILITVDDVDRLRPEEIVEVMRLVRLVGDFPNLIYVLVFERERVEEALGGGPDRRAVGHGYLEKIVQAVFEMPAVAPDARDEVLVEAMNEAVGDLGRLTFSQDAFANIYAHGLRRLFGSLRDVRRFSNVLPATVELIRDEVELSDVLALEALRLLEPEVFALIDAHPEALTSTGDRGLGRADASEQARHKQVVEELLASARRPEPVTELINELFPSARRHMGGTTYGEGWEGRWRRERRVAAREILDIYLARGLPRGALPTALVRRFMASLDQRDTLAALLADLDGDALELLFKRLEDYEGQFETQHPEIAIGALLDVSDRLRTGRRGLFDAGADIALTRVLLRILRGRDPQEVARAVAAVQTVWLWGRYELVLMVGYVEGAGHRMVSEPAAGDLEHALVDELLAASAERLRGERDVAALLGMAWRLDPDALRPRLSEWLQDTKFLIALLRSATLESLATTTGRAGVRRRYQLNWPALARMAGQDRLAQAVHRHGAELEAMQLDEVERQVLEQARRYADDPSLADAHLRRWGTSSDD